MTQTALLQRKRQCQCFGRLRSLRIDGLRGRAERAGRSALDVPVSVPKTVKNRVHLDLCDEEAAEFRSSRSVLS